MWLPEGLCNMGPTFYGMTKVAFKEQVGRNIFTCVDDIVVARKKKRTYISGLAETFTNMCEALLKMNPEKCVFRVKRGKMIRCLVSLKGIQANPDKITVIIQMKPLQTRKDV
jgi:hypothetical protein